MPATPAPLVARATAVVLTALLAALLAMPLWFVASEPRTPGTLTLAVGGVEDSVFANDKTIGDLRGLLRTEGFQRELADRLDLEPADLRGNLSLQGVESSRFVELRFEGSGATQVTAVLQAAAELLDEELAAVAGAEFRTGLARAEADVADADAAIDALAQQAGVDELRQHLSELDRQLSTYRSQQAAAMQRGEATATLDALIAELEAERSRLFSFEAELGVAERNRSVALDEVRRTERRLEQAEAGGAVATVVDEVNVGSAARPFAQGLRTAVIAAAIGAGCALAALSLRQRAPSRAGTAAEPNYRAIPPEALTADER